jgi:CBS domain-containing protein
MAEYNFPAGTDTGPVATGVAEISAGEKSKAKDIAQYGVATIDKDTNVYQAIALMVRKNISGLPVVDKTGLVGIISEKDVLKLLYDSEFVAGSVADYMTKELVTFDEEDNITDICECLTTRGFRRVLITQQGRLAAIISRADLIKANLYKFAPPNSARNSSVINGKPTARDVMKSGLVTVKKQTPLYEAMYLLATKNITGLPVVDDYMNLVGMLSEKDMLKLLYSPKAKPGFVVDFMTKETVSFDKNTSLSDICHCLINNNFRRVPILESGRLVGLISRTDIIAYILKNRTAFFKQKDTN